MAHVPNDAAPHQVVNNNTTENYTFNTVYISHIHESIGASNDPAAFNGHKLITISLEYVSVQIRATSGSDPSPVINTSWNLATNSGG